MPKKVLCFGTFDLLHKGHESFLADAKTYGDELYVVIALDSTVQKIKKLTPIEDQETRRKRVAALSHVHHAMLGHPEDYYRVINEIMPDVICLGYDQHAMQLEQELKERKINTRIQRLPAYKPELYKTSIMRMKREHNANTS